MQDDYHLQGLQNYNFFLNDANKSIFFRAETRKVAMEIFMSGSNPDVIDGVMRDKYATERDNRLLYLRQEKDIY